MSNASRSPHHSDPMAALFGATIDERDDLAQGLKNLATLPAFDPAGGSPKPVPGKDFSSGVIGFRRGGRNLNLAIACGKAMVRYIPLQKYVAMVEKMHDPDSATIMLQNFSEQEDFKASRGQVLGRINMHHSAIAIVQGVTGRIVRGPSDIALYDVYYLDRQDLAAYYVAAKFQISNDDTLESMIAAFDGWRAFEVPLNPLSPFATESEFPVSRGIEDEQE